MQIPFTGAAYQSRSSNLDAQRCINFFLVTGESGTAKSQRVLFGTPGLRLLTTLGGSAGMRGVYTPSVGDAIAVQGYSVYRLTMAFVATLAGYIDSESRPVSIADDGIVAVIVTGGAGYVLNLATNALTQITDPAFYGSSRVSYQNLKFVFSKPGTNVFYLATQSAGELVFDGLDYSSAESNAEPIISHIINHEELLLFKKTVTEVWRDVGNPDFSYSRDTNASIEQGCAAPYSLVELDNTVFFLSADKNGQGIVCRLDGYTPRRISDEGVELAIQGYADISDAVGYAYQKDGHSFYVLNFPSANATWVYDVKEQAWHERLYLNPATGNFNRHRSNCCMFFAGEHVVGDWENGNLYALDMEYYSDNGDPMVSLRSCAHLADQDYKNIRIDSIQVDIEAGVGLESGQGSDPLMMMRWSKDGGHTWSPLRTMSMGQIGRYARRARLTRLGTARDWVFEISISDPVKRVVLGAAIDAKVLLR